MMETQQSAHLTNCAEAVEGVVSRLPEGRVVALDGHGGRVSVLAGRVWLTRDGDLEDHLLGPGQTLSLPRSRGTLVESWGRGPALIAWRRRSALEHLRDAVLGTCDRCWELMHPAGRVSIGSVAALAALLFAGTLFGPVADARVRSLAAPPTHAAVLHNAGRAAVGATETRGSFADGSDTRDGPRPAAQEARRRAPGAA
jgi:hypothetical protein